MTEITATTYEIFRRLESGDYLWLASFEDLYPARQLAQSLRTYWPGDYLIRNRANGEAIDADEGLDLPITEEVCHL